MPVTISDEMLERIETALGIIPCEECEHSLYLHFDRNGCEYERGDGYRLGREYEEALGPCCCKAENLSDDGNATFLLLRDIRQLRLLNLAQTSRNAKSGS